MTSKHTVEDNKENGLKGNEAGSQESENDRNKSNKRAGLQNGAHEKEQQHQHQSPTKRPRRDETGSVVDVAESLGIKPGDRLSAKWNITFETDGRVTTRWWGATLMEHDGRTTDDNVAIRVLQYDPYPEGGFPESSLEDVVFLSRTLLLNDATDELEYRREGSTEEEETVALSEDRLREELNGMITSILNKHGKQWQSLDAAHQARIAELFSTGKEKIIEVVQDRWQKDHKVIKAEDIPSILEDAFSELGETK